MSSLRGKEYNYCEIRDHFKIDCIKKTGKTFPGRKKSNSSNGSKYIDRKQAISNKYDYIIQAESDTAVKEILRDDIPIKIVINVETNVYLLDNSGERIIIHAT